MVPQKIAKNLSEHSLRALAIDAKWIRDRALSLCLSEHPNTLMVAIWPLL